MSTEMGKKLAYADTGPHFMVTKGGDADLTYRAEGGNFQLGKRYQAAAAGITILCTKPGPGELTVDGEPLQLLEAKKLPSSD